MSENGIHSAGEDLRGCVTSFVYVYVGCVCACVVFDVLMFLFDVVHRHERGNRLNVLYMYVCIVQVDHNVDDRYNEGSIPLSPARLCLIEPTTDRSRCMCVRVRVHL